MDTMFKPDRRTMLATAAAASAFGLAAVLPVAPAAAEGDDAIRPFRIRVPEEALIDLRRRLAATRWPDQEIVADQSQGVQLATLQQLVRYWETQYDWRKVEARLNGLPQFVMRMPCR
jgi:Epoxide hydrolase N terminus